MVFISALCAIASIINSLISYKRGFWAKSTLFRIMPKRTFIQICKFIIPVFASANKAETRIIITTKTKSRSGSFYMDQIVNLPSDVHAPYVGDAAFAHKGGAHIDGVMKVSRSFEHIDPHAVGNDRVFVTSDQAGGSLVVEKLKAIKPGIDKKDPVVGKLLTLIKERENAGWHFDSAEASFKLLVYRHLGMVQEPFKVLGYRVIEDKTPQGVSVSQATVKLQIGDKISHQVSEGDGPVNALDAALRKALLPFFPNMAKVKLDDYVEPYAFRKRRFHDSHRHERVHGKA